MEGDSLVLLLIFGTLLLMLIVCIFIAFLIIHRQHAQKAKAKLIETELSHENELLLAQIKSQEAAMIKISYEVHDNIGQVMSITRMQLLDVLNKKKSQAELLAYVQQATDRMDQCIKDLRNLSHIFNGKMVGKMGLKMAIEKELSFIRSVCKITCNFDYACDIELTSAQHLLLFRITQECLNNILRHAEATVIHIKFTCDQDELTLFIQDNGRGFDLSKLTEGKSMGLVSIHERIMMLNGKLNITSVIGQGSSISITINLTKNGPIQNYSSYS